MFEISARRDGEGGATGCEVVGGHEIFGMVRMSPTYLPRRSGESRFAPAQYYYQASKTGAVPSWRYQ
jgi:hypothetical protein